MDDHFRIQGELLALVDEYTRVLEESAVTMGDQVSIGVESTTALRQTSEELKRQLKHTTRYMADL